MPVGPFVFWSGGAGAAPPPPLSADRFSPKYLVGNFPAGDLAAATSFGGFIYIQDPGDGSGVTVALAQPNGLGDVYVRPGNYSGVGVFTVPANVRVVGAGTEVTVFDGFTFVMNSESALSSVSVSTDTDFCVRSAVGAVGILLQDLKLAAVGGSGCIQITGSGVQTPYPEPTSIQRVEGSLTTGLGLNIRAGAVVSVDTLNMTGGMESILSESDAVLFGSRIFTDTSNVSIHFIGHTGVGRASVQDSQFLSEATTLVVDDATANLAFTRCVLRNLVGGTSMNFAGGTLSDSVFAQCEITSTGLGIENISGSRISFLDCNITSQSVSNATLNTGTSSEVLVQGGYITNTGPGFAASRPVSLANLRVESTAGAEAAVFSGPGGSLVTGSVFISASQLGCVSVNSPNNTFCSTRVQGIVSYTSNAVGNTASALSVDATSLGVPAILVDGSANVFTSIRTLTDPVTPGMSLSLSAQNNIVTVLSAFGPGLGGLAVQDSGVGNEIAHLIST